MQHTTNLFVTTNHRVELALLGEFVQVLGEAVQTVVILLGILRVDLLAFAELHDGLLQFALADALVLHHLRGIASAFKNGQQHVLDGDVFVAHFLGQSQGIAENLADLGRVIQFSTAAARLRVDGLVKGFVEAAQVDAQLFHQVGHQVIVAQQHTLQQVDGLNGLALVGLSNLLSLPDGFLRFDGELIDVHFCFSFLFLTAERASKSRPRLK